MHESKAGKPWKETLRLGVSLAVADFKLRNEGSYLGILWYLLNPLLLFVILLFIKGAAFSKTAILHYPIFLLFGLVLNNFFTKLIRSSTDLIRKNGALLKTVRFDSRALVVSEFLQIAFSHFFEVLLIVFFMSYFKVSLSGLAWYPVVFSFFALFMIGASFLAAAMGIFVYDLGNVWDAVSSLIFFITPTFYVIDQSTLLYKVNLFNPLYYYLTIFRDLVVYGTIPPARMLLFAALMSLVSFSIGFKVFELRKKRFSELV